MPARLAGPPVEAPRGRGRRAKKAEKFNSLNMSSAVSVSFAPCDELVAAAAQGVVDRARYGEHLPIMSSPASRAVISEPLRAPPRPPACRDSRPAMMRFRCGKLPRRGGVPSGKFADQGALLLMARSSPVAPRIDDVDPAAQHREVIPCAASAPRCAALSMPSARPLVMASPRPARYSRNRTRFRGLRGGIAAADHGQLRIAQRIEVCPRHTARSGGSRASAAASG
jgi:hypothetical protein